VKLAAFTVSLDAPSSSLVSVDFATADGSAINGSDYVTAAGRITFAPGETTRTILVATVNDNVPEPTETFTLILSNPVGATIAAGQGVATIMDDDTTKFYVVDDNSTDRMYDYGLPGTALGSSGLGSGNTVPRGAASNTTGTILWVVDANKKVYVYNTSGGLLGSWTAGGLNANAQLEGLATDGTDVWLLDNKQDKVFKYTGAASRLSGTQNAASSFNLNSGNSNGKGLVTDGTSFWIVDDGSSTDKVFKYTLAGNLLGSWTIDAANTHPTGLTINPAAVSDIWVVDNGTLKVYQYTAAASRTSGSQSAAATFALAAGNTNPQDIADPPAPGTFLTAGNSLLAATAPPAERPLMDTLATPAVPSAALAPTLVGWLVPSTLVPSLPALPADQPAFTAAAAPLAAGTPPAGHSAPAMPGPKPMPTGASASPHQSLDQVFSDLAVEMIDDELQSYDMSSV
jgi:hypothetical protein